jgi:hypothetical protein
MNFELIQAAGTLACLAFYILWIKRFGQDKLAKVDSRQIRRKIKGR